jgi:hypothetical protein
MAKGYLTQNQTRIIFSTPAMIIVTTTLGILIIALAALPFWTKSWEKTLIDLKREPEVLGAVLGYVCDSSGLMGMFKDKAFTTLSELEAFLKQSGSTVRIGKSYGQDGQLRYGIELEEGTRWADEVEGEEVEPRSLTPIA